MPKMLVGYIVLLAAILSCGNLSVEFVTPTPLRTTTNTPTPTTAPPPTNTPTQSSSPTPANTSTPLASPTLTHTPTPEGWVKHTAGKIEIWLPNSWEEWEVTEDTLAIVNEALQEMTPQYADFMKEMLEQPEMMEALRIFAVDTEGEGANMNITEETLPIPLNINDFVSMMVQVYEELGAENISTRILELNGMKAAQAQYDLPIQVSGYGTIVFRDVQYVVLKGQKVYVISFTTDPQEYPTLLPTIEQIANSFRIND